MRWVVKMVHADIERTEWRWYTNEIVGQVENDDIFKKKKNYIYIYKK